MSNILPIDQAESPNQVDTAAVALYDQTLEQFKSLFYLVKGKRDTQIKLYSDNKGVAKNNLLDLNNKIQEKLLLHNVSNKIVNVSVGLSNNHIKSFGNWQEFVNEKWDTSDKTESVTLTWDFEIVLPNRLHTIPQTHSLKVRVGRELKPSEFIHIMMIGGTDEFELEESQAQMVAKVDFVNATIATELLEKVNEWYKALPFKEEDNPENRILNKHSRKIVLTVETLVIIAGLTLFFPIAKYLLQNYTSQIIPIAYLTCSYYLMTGVFVSFTIFSRVGSYYARKIDNAIDRLQGNPLIELTSGDKNELARRKNKNKSIRREIYMKLLISMLSSGILYVAGLFIKFILEHVNS